MRVPGILLFSLCLAASSVSTAGELAAIYQKVKGSVVMIEVSQKDVDPGFPGRPVELEGLGSGVLISNDGKVATAAHVVHATDRIQVHFLSGETIPARVLYSVPAADLALIQLERLPAEAAVAEIGDSDEVAVGDEIFVVGAPFGNSHSLTVGHISARRISDELFAGMLPTEQFQTDAAINEGNSGGPMFNMRGEVVGIVSYILSYSGGFEGLGFVVTSNMARRLLLEERALWSGFQARWIDGELGRVLNIPGGSGVLVEVVAERSLARVLGLRGGTLIAAIGEETLIVGGDVIVEAFGIAVAAESLPEIRERMNSLEEGDTVEVTVLRAGEIVKLNKTYYPHLLLPPAPAAE